MADTFEDLALRTLYMPLSMDRRLREIAFARGVSQSELMHVLISMGLADITASGEKTVAEQIEDRITQVEQAARGKCGRGKAKSVSRFRIKP